MPHCPYVSWYWDAKFHGILILQNFGERKDSSRGVERHNATLL